MLHRPGRGAADRGRDPRRAVRRHDHAVRELWVPLSDKHSVISLPRRRSSSGDGVHVFFEELFARCARDAEFFRSPNVVFFNLNHFRFPEHCDADGLIFNSKYLMECFRHEAFSRGLSPPPMIYAPAVPANHGFGTRLRHEPKRPLGVFAHEHAIHALEPAHRRLEIVLSDPDPRRGTRR